MVQSLDKGNAIDDLSDLLNKNPRVLRVLQLLISHTPQKIFFDEKDKYVDFESDLKRIEQDKERAKEIGKSLLKWVWWSF